MLIYAVLNLCTVEVQPDSTCLQNPDSVRWTLNDTDRPRPQGLGVAGFIA